MRLFELGEQLNLIGYSYGSVAQAHIALALIDLGYKVDNLILVGSPISDDSDLYKELVMYQEQGKIGQLIRHDIPQDKLSNPKSDAEFAEGGMENVGPSGPHFDLARPDDESTPNVNEEQVANEQIRKLAKKLKKKGVK